MKTLVNYTIENLRQDMLNQAILLADPPLCEAENFHYRVDNRNLLLSNPNALIATAELIWENIKHLEPEVLFTKGFGGASLLSAVQTVALMRDSWALYTLLVRDSRKNHGTRKLVEGAAPQQLAGKRAVFVDDLFDQGRAFTYCKEELVNEGFTLDVVGVACLMDFWRDNGSRRLTVQGFPFYSVFRRHDFNLTRQDHYLGSIVKGVNWRTFSFHNGQNIMPWKGIPSIHGNYVLLGNDDNNHYCFDAKTGDVVWKHVAERPQPKGVCAETKVHDGRVYWTSYDGTVRCYTLEGEHVWTNLVDLNIHSSVCLDPENDRLFVGTEWNKHSIKMGGYGEGDIVCLRMSDGNEVWRHKTNGMVACTPIYSKLNNTVICGNNDFHIHLLNADSGKLIARIPTYGEVKGFLSLSKNGTIAICMTVKGVVYAIDTKHGTVLWKRRAGITAPQPIPCVFDNSVVVTNGNHGMMCMDIDSGWVRWVCITREEIGSGVIDVGEKLLAVTMDGQIHLLDKYTGEKLTSDKLSDIIQQPVIVGPPPAFDGENLIISTSNAGVISLRVDV